jgi:hypothetical protein
VASLSHDRMNGSGISHAHLAYHKRILPHLCSAAQAHNMESYGLTSATDGASVVSDSPIGGKSLFVAAVLAQQCDYLLVVVTHR